MSRGRRTWLLVVAVAIVAGVMLSRRHRTPGGPPYAAARAIVNRHCLGCHSEHPTVPAFPIAPKGIELDTSEEMQQYAALISTTVKVTRTMPMLNKTGMTEEERALLSGWVEAGARVP